MNVFGAPIDRRSSDTYKESNMEFVIKPFITQSESRNCNA